MIISAYRGFTAAAIKARADIPAQADMTVVETTVDCKNISVSMVRNILNSPSSGVNGVASDSNVNVWSGFGPTVRTAPAGVLINSAPGAGSLGSFAGYNHYATAPRWYNEAPSGDIWISSGTEATFDCTIYIGEVKWEDLGIIGAVHAIYDGAVLVGWVGVDFDNDLIVDIVDLSLTLSNLTLSKTYTGKVWLVSHLVDWTESDNVCSVPNVGDYTRQVKVLPATTAILQAAEGWTASVGYNNSPDGTVYYTNLEGDATYDEVRVYASIWSYREGLMGSEILIDTFAPWHHDDFASGSGQPNGSFFIWASGYICTIRVEAINY